MFYLFLFFTIMVTRVCAHHVEKIRKVYRRFISLIVRFRENGAKNSNFFKIKIIIAENWDVWPIFIFTL